MTLAKLLRPFLRNRRRAALRAGDHPARPGRSRQELFNLEQLKAHAQALARHQAIVRQAGRDELLSRLAENERALVAAYTLVNAASRAGRRITPASEWLLDNFYLIEQQIQLARRHLPRNYSRQLPRLRNNPQAGQPRVYALALELISHADGCVDAGSLTAFITAYQTVAPLALGELWAVPIMLRLALIENLRCAADRIVKRRTHRDLAVHWAERLLRAAEQEPKHLIEVLAEFSQIEPPYDSGAFVEEFLARLQGHETSVAFVVGWLEHRLAEEALNVEQLCHAYSQDQSADQVSIANSIGSLRFIGAADWHEFVESLSVTERLLRRDPYGAYARQTFETRDRYRHAIEEIALRTALEEAVIADRAIELAREAMDREGAVSRRAHVGYYLIDEGRPQLEQTIAARSPLSLALRRPGRPGPLSWYLFPAGLVTVILAAFPVAVLQPLGLDDWRYWLLAVAAWISASSLALPLVNLLVPAVAPPRVPPRLDFSKGIPPGHRTLVAIPSLLRHQSGIDALLEKLEIRYLGNRDPGLSFALVTDLADADSEHLPSDAALLATVREGIAALNEKYRHQEGRAVFYLFHRPRRWNPHERLWMGYERKRGKLVELNALLQTGAREPFSVIDGDPAGLQGMQYVITLDADTQLPRGAAHELVGAMAHPLNQPVFDERKGRIVAGYAILQPRVSVSLPSASRSLFSRLFVGEAGIDPYTREVSDVYQDLFGEGSFIGKGIYHIDAFQRALEGRLPENLILSHDLIESGYARAALATDIELFEDHPSSYLVEVSRRHRWIRGDWQIAGWLLPRTPGPDGHWQRNPLSALSRWKILDNLRRSLVAPALVATWVGGVLALPAWAGFWTAGLVAVAALPAVVSAALELLRKPTERAWRTHLELAYGNCLRHLGLAGLRLVNLPHTAFFSLDAILNSGLRMWVTRRGLLLWHTTEYAQRNARHSLAGFMAEMWFAPALALTLVATRPDLMLTAVTLPMLLAWTLAPVTGWWISRPLRRAEPELNDTDRDLLRAAARRTWRYFEEFFDEQDHWLPPDNFQALPVPALATRTSPTNLGMALLANLAAHDLGYLSTGQFLERTASVFHSMAKLQRFRGHFFNWYDTRTLQPLRPQYVSSVDSGNLAAALVALRAGLQGLRTQPALSPRMCSGLDDTLLALDSELSPDDGSSGQLLASLRKRLHACPRTPAGARTLLGELHRDAGLLVTALSGDPVGEARWWALAFERQCLDLATDLECGLPADDADAREKACARLRLAGELAARCDAWIAEMDFSFLFDATRKLLAIGYNVNERRRDPSYYDLLASEARLASFLLIAQGQLPQEHWFALGRLLTGHDGATALLSWSGSMFEYLMPELLLPSYPGTLLHQTCHAAVQRQIQYGRQRNVPWGISESCYHAFDLHQVYQYRAFGVPGLGFKRGLSDDLVVAPYASALALTVAPQAACENLRRLADQGYLGAYGFIEAIDYTPSRVPDGARCAPVHAFMAHHQGMSLVAFAHVLLDRPMQRRVMSEPLFKAAELLLHERVPRTLPTLHQHAAEVSRLPASAVGAAEPAARVYADPTPASPEVHLLSNGSYHVMVTQAGGGYSRWRDLAVTRWREDRTRDNWGTFVYLRDVDTGRFWSAAFQPTLRPPDSYEAVFAQALAEFRRRDEELEVRTRISISAEDDVEVRRVQLTNLSRRPRTIEVTSYAEVVLAPLNADLAHRAFSNLFVQTELVQDQQAILCSRRPRAAGEAPPWMLHLVTAQGLEAGPASCETDRARFIGRGRTPDLPRALDEIGPGEPLSNTAGPVLDPIVAMRRVVTLPPDGSAILDIVTGVAETRAAATALVDKFRDPRFADRAFEMAWSQRQMLLRHLDMSEADAQVCARLAGSILHAGPLHRASSGVLARNRLGQSALWRYGISGDWPIVLVRIANTQRLELVRQALRAHAFWRSQGVTVDLVILNEDFSGYRQVLQDRITALTAGGAEANLTDKPGGIFVRRSEQLTEEERVLFQSVARVVVSDSQETLADQAERRPVPERLPPRLVPAAPRPDAANPAAPVPRDLTAFNGLGGFTRDGREYVVTLAPGQVTPAPWANVIANPAIGTVVTESGGAYTWVENCHEFRLTPWHNDPVTDASGEALYLRDEQTGRVWSPTSLPARGTGHYVSRHGFGYSVFEHDESGVNSELWTFAAIDAPVKLYVLKLRNRSGRPRRLSATGYWELVLGEWRHANLMHVVTEVDARTGAIFARNYYSQEFAERVVFASVSEAARTLTGSRSEFIGRNGTAAAPAALARTHLSGRVGAGLDPCAALQTAVDLADRQERQIVFLLGAGRSPEEAQKLVHRFGTTGGAQQALEAVWRQWNELLGSVQIETPEPTLNFLVNGWLPYQTLACRVWGRSGYYQSGGAFGFRDQLQDTMALMHTAPWTAREQLLRCAERQFLQGDVQHWWHPPRGRGVRTHCSDDYLWLPYATCRYVGATADTGVLDERVAFLEGRPVNADDDDYYDLPTRSLTTATLYEHCVRAIEHGLRFGPNGLPLMGGGDWNDGMNRVGPKGRGESVWLGWFLCDVLRQFTALATRRGDQEFAGLCRTKAAQLQANIEANAWDGGWYRRAWFDDGTPLGSADNEECRIDSISQSWAVISGAGDPQRARQAMDAVDRLLVRRDAQLIQLLGPPFDKSALEPGYVKGYAPGVRENGGQYTHGAIWTVMAFALLGDRERAWELFRMLDPASHAATGDAAARYQVEPYVMPADIYGAPPHVGRGGWTWYTGSAGWMYRVALETLLGLHREGTRLRLAPNIPDGWPGFTIHYRFHQTMYHLVFKRSAGKPERVLRVLLDGAAQADNSIPLADDRSEHRVEVELGAA